MKTALVIIDVQKSLIDEAPWNAESVLERIARLLALAREAGVPVAFIRDRRVEPDGSLHPRLKVLGSDIHIEKSYSDSFLETDLGEQIQERGVKRLIITGLQTDYCIDTTCRRAASLGFEVVLVGDAHTTFDHRCLSADQIVAHHNYILRHFPAAGGSVRVVQSDGVVFT
jgi:nicotinamidase-related amidase